MNEEIKRILEVATPSFEPEERHRELPGGGHISLYEQIFNWKVVYSSSESWPYTWDEAY